MNEPQGETTFSGCFLAAFRNLAGPGFLLAVSGALIVNRPQIGSGTDLLFIAVAVANVVAGLLYKPPQGTPKEGTGQVQGVSRIAFVAAVLAISVIVWGITHFVLRQ
jgi:hypothetical protein